MGCPGEQGLCGSAKVFAATLRPGDAVTAVMGLNGSAIAKAIWPEF